VSRLPVISQDCQNCPLKRKCWNTSKAPSDEVLVINLLVCRLKLGIKRDAATRLLLQMLEPKVLQTVKFIERNCSVDDREGLKVEVQSTIVEYLLSEYKLGERAWPLHYLFSPKKGVMTGWALKYVEKQRMYARSMQLDTTDDDLEWSLRETNAQVTAGQVLTGPPEPFLEPEPEPEPEPQLTPVAQALQLVEDGATLTTREYRVLRFCLTQTGRYRGASQDTNLHGWLAEAMSLDRSSGVSRVFRKAAAKLVEALGHTDRVLELETSGLVDPEQRRRRVLGLDGAALTESEGRALVSLADEVGAAVACQAFGVHDRTLYALRRRYAAKKTDPGATHRPDHVEHGVSA
jgi:hypothetical protein